MAQKYEVLNAAMRQMQDQDQGAAETAASEQTLTAGGAESQLQDDSQHQNHRSLLSPHNSVFQALNNPELGELSKVNSRNVCDSPDLSANSRHQQHQPQQQEQQHQQEQQRNTHDGSVYMSEFSSWHMVPQNSQGSGSNVSRPSSILSSSDAEENSNTSHYVINNYIPQQPLAHPLQQRTDAVMFFDNESPNSEDEDLKTELEDNNSTIHQIERLRMPSFIMPKMSVMEEDSEENANKLKINIVGEFSGPLINRLNSYGKILQNVKFNSINPDLVILIVDQNNLLLSQQMSKPFIPVFISDKTESSLYEQDLQSTMSLSVSKICQPIRLKSCDDDLFQLINVLSSIDIKAFHEKRLSSTSVFSHRRSSSVSTSTPKKIKKKAERSPGKKVNRLVESIFRFMSENSGKLVLSLGYLGLCYCGISYLLSKRDAMMGPMTGPAVPNDLLNESHVMAEADFYLDEFKNEPTLINVRRMHTVSDDSPAHWRHLRKNAECVLDSLLERGKLTGYWLYYNLFMLWD